MEKQTESYISASSSADRKDDSNKDSGNDGFREFDRSHVIPSGLSALIKAATAQLSDLMEEEKRRKDQGVKPAPKNQDLDVLSRNDQPDEKCDMSCEEHSQDDFSKREVKRPPQSMMNNDQNHEDKDQDNNSKSNNTTPLMMPEPMDASKTQSFPSMLMTLALDPNNEDIIAFLPDGKYFAIRVKKFVTEVMPHFFSSSSWQEFLALMHDWGFSRILHDEDDDACGANLQEPSDAMSLSTEESDFMNNDHVEIFRHPKFIKGDRKLCEVIRHGESPTHAILSALPDKGIFDFRTEASPMEETLSSSNVSPAKHLYQHKQQQVPKRRLSPRSSSTIRRRNSDFTTPTCSPFRHAPKKRMSWDGSFQTTRGILAMRPSGDEDTRGGTREQIMPSTTSSSIDELDLRHHHHSGHATRQSRSDDIRSVALALTTEKLNLRRSSLCRGSTGANTMPSDASSVSSINSKNFAMPTGLVDRALQSATHTIVTDAIESLLYDANHTKETYLKHSQELSRSTLPGVIPISKQLFEQRQQQRSEIHQQRQTAQVPSQIISTAHTKSEEEAASAIVAAAIEAEKRAFATSSATSPNDK